MLCTIHIFHHIAGQRDPLSTYSDGSSFPSGNKNRGCMVVCVSGLSRSDEGRIGYHWEAVRVASGESCTSGKK